MSNISVTSSGLKTSDATIVAKECRIHAITLIPAAADCSVVVYDTAGTAAVSGSEAVKITALANGASQTQTFNNPIICSLGAWADVSGSAAGYIVHYSL